MSDAIDKILSDAQRLSRDHALDAAIELCEMVAKDGGCTFCCIEAIAKLKRELHARDLTEDALAKAAKQ